MTGMSLIGVIIISFSIGFVLGHSLWHGPDREINGYLLIDTSNKEVDRWTIDIHDDPEKAKYVILEVMRKNV